MGRMDESSSADMRGYATGTARPAVRRQAFEQDRAKRLRTRCPRAARADVVQLSSSRPDAHDLAAHGRQRLDLGDGVVDVLLDRAVREQDDVGLVLAFRRLLLDHRVDADLAVGEDARDVREHAGLVFHAHAQVIARDHVADRQERHVGELVGLECKMRHAMLGVAVCMRVTSTRSAITALAVGSAPAPAP
jgi:hypothetical protein